MIVLLISYIALGIEWLVALLQSVLFYAEIAVAGLFVGFLLVPGLQNIAKGFLLSFVAISLWPIAFLIVGLVTKFVISIGINASNNGGVGAANEVGMSYFWLIVLALVVGVGSTVGPWWLSKRVVAGASGMADLLVGSVAAGRGVFSAGAKAAGAAATGGGSAAAGGGPRAATGGSRRFP
jgi:type IV secretion system protein TrbL